MHLPPPWTFQPSGRARRKHFQRLAGQHPDTGTFQLLASLDADLRQMKQEAPGG